MKCKHCNGKGKKYKYFYIKTGVNTWRQVGEDVLCENCDGTGVVEPLTNDEWFCRLPIEGKATFLSEKFAEAIKYAFGAHGENTDEIKPNPSYWQEWLKQPHTK